MVARQEDSAGDVRGVVSVYHEVVHFEKVAAGHADNRAHGSSGFGIHRARPKSRVLSCTKQRISLGLRKTRKDSSSVPPQHVQNRRVLGTPSLRSSEGQAITLRLESVKLKSRHLRSQPHRFASASRVRLRIAATLLLY